MATSARVNRWLDVSSGPSLLDVRCDVVELLSDELPAVCATARDVAKQHRRNLQSRPVKGACGLAGTTARVAKPVATSFSGDKEAVAVPIVVSGWPLVGRHMLSEHRVLGRLRDELAPVDGVEKAHEVVGGYVRAAVAAIDDWNGEDIRSPLAASGSRVAHSSARMHIVECVVAAVRHPGGCEDLVGDDFVEWKRGRRFRHEREENESRVAVPHRRAGICMAWLVREQRKEVARPPECVARRGDPELSVASLEISSLE